IGQDVGGRRRRDRRGVLAARVAEQFLHVHAAVDDALGGVVHGHPLGGGGLAPAGFEHAAVEQGGDEVFDLRAGGDAGLRRGGGGGGGGAGGGDFQSRRDVGDRLRRQADDADGDEVADEEGVAVVHVAGEHRH